MGALATEKSTHISVVVPMTGYALCSVFAFYVLFDRKYQTGPLPLDKEKSDIGESD
jgi:hypothetical protein